MGQLEKYGLYVLVVVIFLILGVAIWGDPEPSDVENLAVLDTENSLGAGDAGGKGTGSPLVIDSDDLYDFTDTPTQRRGGQGTGDSPTGGSPTSGSDDGPVIIDPKPDPNRTGRVVEPTALQHTVRPGETMSSIAKQYYGDPNLYRAIQNANPGVNPNSMQRDTVLVIPPRGTVVNGGGDVVGTAGRATAGGATGSTYLVVQNDSPARISKKLYGRESFQNEIMRLNAISDPTKLRVGTTIRLPYPPGQAPSQE